MFKNKSLIKDMEYTEKNENIKDIKSRECNIDDILSVFKEQEIIIRKEEKTENKKIKKNNIVKAVDITNNTKQSPVKENKESKGKRFFKKNKIVSNNKKSDLDKVKLHEFIDLESDKAIKEETVIKAPKGIVDKIKYKKERAAIKNKEKELRRIQKENERVEKTSLINDWCTVMHQNNAKDNYNNTYRLEKVKQEDYGWSFNVYPPKGLSLARLDTLTQSIDNALGGKFTFKVDITSAFARCTVAYENKVKCNEILFKPLRVRPNEVFMGLTVDGKGYFADLIPSPHVMVAGATRKGKNGATDSIILSWLNSCTPEEINLFLFQCSKNDLSKYKRCRHVKTYQEGDFKKMNVIMKHILEVEIPERLKLFEDMVVNRKGTNIMDYNRLNPDNKLPIMVLIFDEFITLKNQDKDNKEDKEANGLKNSILTSLGQIASMGASVGIFYLVVHQKPEKVTDCCYI